MNEDIRFILEEALHAPSGDNSQPWHWVVQGNTLELWSRISNDPTHSLYSNSINSGSSAYLAHGAAIENACLAASTRGYAVAVSYFPDQSRMALVATLALSKDSRVEPNPLAEAIASRVTNRRPYRREPLDPLELARLAAAGTDPELGELTIVAGQAQMNALAKIASLQDELMFSCRDLHDYIFANINWTKRADAIKRTGFYFPTLGAPPFTRFPMWLLGRWWITRLGSFFGLHKIIALEQRWIYRHAGAYAMVFAREDTPEGWVRAGRLTERIWLTAHQMGVSSHPLNGVIYLGIGSETPEGKRAFSRRQRQRLHDACEELSTLFGAEGKTLAFLFRLGYARPPASRTSRRTFQEMVEVGTSAPRS